MLHAWVERFDVMDGRENILGWDEEVNKAYIHTRGVASRFGIERVTASSACMHALAVGTARLSLSFCVLPSFLHAWRDTGTERQTSAAVPLLVLAWGRRRPTHAMHRWIWFIRWWGREWSHRQKFRTIDLDGSMLLQPAASYWSPGATFGLCLVPQKKHCAEKRFPVTSNLRYMHGVLNVDEIKN
jgi:hypothetical protein